ncbi:uncharacterized protein LOC108632128 [Ceratina calcarata]|uniref:Uncharacterized protein LOC108632128 n=1 Tax=Ceratina calcarata TaxID=156304 RepID=A0AAJ7JG08_9HYME|nr:uncharacterized protein LOC108632128 [Ceratina calcarata]
MNANKRQKVPIKPDRLEDTRKDFEKRLIERRYHGYALDTLPPEVLEMVLRLLPLHDVSTSVRLVSRHCSTIASIVLNGAFLTAGARIEGLMRRIEDTMKHAKVDHELLVCNKAYNTAEVIKAQYKMLRAVTWRYTHPPGKQEKFPRLCFYAGSLLDKLNEILARAAKYRTSSIRELCTVNADVTAFTSLCKRFMNFFEKVSERRVNKSSLISGCKVIDILDCLVEGRQVLAFKVMSSRHGETVNMKLRYTIKRAWFTCLDVTKNADEESWRDEQRFMYLRLRRLVGSVNEHFFENLHYEKNLLFQIPLTDPLRPPPASTYSGYGEYGGKFFYYGNMNKYAYESKFTHAAVSTMDLTVETEEQVHKAPTLDLVIDIELKCTPELAPLEVRSILRSDEFEAREMKTCKYQQLFLRMNVTCPASLANRLAGNFVWELRSPRRARQAS